MSGVLKLDCLDDAKGYKKISEKFSFLFGVELTLTDSQTTMIISGIESIYDDAYFSSKTVLQIESVVFNYCDFQEDALYWSSRMLFSKLLNEDFEMPKIEFDKKKNRYLFTAPNDL